MSEKQASIDITATDEGFDAPVLIVATVDFINPGNLYLNIPGRLAGLGAIAIPDRQARKLAEFILKETRDCT